MSRSPHRTRAAAIAFVVACVTHSLAVNPLPGQTTTIAVHGAVAANDGMAVEGATVQIDSRETGISRRVSTDRGGTYRLLGLPPGTYSLSVRALGYRMQRRDSLRLIHGQRTQIDVVLERGAVELAPTVVQAGRALDVQRSDVSTAVLQEEIENLPLNTRNVLNLAAIAPGIRTFALEGGRSQPTAGALPVAEGRFANLYVDGVDWRGVYAGGIIGAAFDGSMVPQEALREFRVSLNPYDVELTRGGAYVMSAVTHRGGNSREGSLFSFHQDRNFVARSASQARTPRYFREQFGGNLRGPLVRDRLFYSLSYESQVTDNYIDVGTPVPVAQPDRWVAYAGTFRAPSRLHNGLLRLSAPLGAHTMDATVAVRDLSREGGFGDYSSTRLLVRDAGLKGRSTLTNVQLRDSYTAASFVNELTFHVLLLRNDQDITVPGPTMLYPSVQIGNPLQPATIRDRHLRLINRSTFTLGGPSGQHVVKAGVELGDLWPRIHRPNFGRGWFDFETDTSQLPLRARIGVPAVGYAGDPASSEAHSWTLGLYFQDEWRPTRRLSITAGARWDADVNTLGQNVIAPWATDTALLRVLGERYLNTGDRGNDLDNIAPRASVTWDALGNATTFLRAGYGVMYDRVPMLGSIPEARDIGWMVYNIPNPGTTDAEQLRQMIAAGNGTARRTLFLIEDDIQTPATRQWSAGVGRKLTRDLAVNVDYLDQRVRDVYVTLLMNVQPRFTTNFGDITVWDDFGDARYRALLLSVTYDRSPTRLSIAYTLGKAESELGRTSDSNYPDTAAYALQRSEGDERHRVVVSGLTRLPFGLQASALAIVASPRPFLVTTGVDGNANGNQLDDWPGRVRTHRRDGWEHWYRTVDVRLAKSIRTGGGRVSVIADVFNVFNTANHAEYQPNASQPRYGEPTGDFARRQGQVGLRYGF